jgi:GT2 family glycosyltransferase
MKLSIVIVSYNVRGYLENCLQSVSRALEGIEGEVFVVDNHSDDDSVETVRTQYPWVRLIENQENMGFSRANNIAIREARGEYVLLLNPDTIVEEATLREVLRFMDEHLKAGGAGVMMHNADGSLAPESRRALPTPWVSCLKMLGFTKRYYMSHLPWDQPGKIEVISGAFCFLRKKALDEVGLLDEDFFMYGEDIDLSYRLLKSGWENWYLPYPITHFKGKSTQKSDYRYVHIFYKAMLIFFRKHYSHLSIFYALPVNMAIYFRAAIALTDILRKKLHL